ncbi:hypothetical protein, partial [Plasmodium yoelii yoelii]
IKKKKKIGNIISGRSTYLCILHRYMFP